MARDRPLQTFIILASFCEILQPSILFPLADVDTIDVARLGQQPGEGPAIEKVHYFGFVLPNRVPWILSPLADVVRWMRPALGRRRSMRVLHARPGPLFGERPAIENVHYFGFVLPNEPSILFLLADVVRWTRPG